jgi:hypothetical protein
MYVKANTGFRRKVFPGKSAWKLRIAYSNKESESCISAGGTVNWIETDPGTVSSGTEVRLTPGRGDE